MNSRNTKRCGGSNIVGAVIIILSLLCMLLLYVNNWLGQGALLIKVEAKEIEGSLLAVISNQLGRENKIDVIAHSCEVVSIANDRRACKGNATYLTAASALSIFEELKLVEGRAFHEADEGKDYILIPESLAIEILGTTACVGKTLTVNEKRYTIVGVYRDHAFIRDALVYETYPPAYILGQDLRYPVFVTIMPVTTRDSELLLSVAMQALKGSGISDLKTYDLAYQVHHVKWSIKGIFCIGLLAIWLRFKRHILKIRNAYKQTIVSVFSQYYLSQALRLSIWQLIGYAVGFLLTWLMVTGIGWLMFFDYVMPSRYIPSTLLYPDVLDQLKQVIHHINAVTLIRHPWVLELAWGERAVGVCVCVLILGSWLYLRKAGNQCNEQGE